MSILPGGFDTYTCNCACLTCMSGSCCLYPRTPAELGTRTWTTTTTGGAITCGALDHDFAVLDPARLFCRKCGTTRKV